MLIAQVSQYFFGISIFATSMFLIMLVLVQRGRGGGLTGALGGPGGQSAFGTKAGDLFTRITVGVATAWIALCASSVYFLKARALPSTGLADSDRQTETMGSSDTTPPEVPSTGSGSDPATDTTPAGLDPTPVPDSTQAEATEFEGDNTDPGDDTGSAEGDAERGETEDPEGSTSGEEPSDGSTNE